MNSRKIIALIAGIIIVGILFKVAMSRPDMRQMITRKPPLPVEIGTREAVLGSGYVIQFKNTSPKTLSVHVELSNPTFKTSKAYNLTIDSGGMNEIGHLEGWKAASGDKIKITSDGFDYMEKTVP